jgi:uncharacterized membrane protein
MELNLNDSQNQNSRKMDFILIISIVLCGLTAGLLYGFSCAVNPGLSRLDDLVYLSAVQSINEKIQNPVFFISFMGSLVVLPVCAYLYYQAGSDKWFFFAIAALLYVIGTFGVTVFGNIPLNKLLEGIQLNRLSIAELAIIRLKFQASWNNFHQIRTIAAFISFALLVYAGIINKY